MNIFIFGIYGFVGFNFIRVLKDKYILYGFDIVFFVKEGVVIIFFW